MDLGNEPLSGHLHIDFGDLTSLAHNCEGCLAVQLGVLGDDFRAIGKVNNRARRIEPVLVWSIYTDVVDYGEWKFGRRTTGLTFAAAMFVQKIGLALGGWLVGFLLAYYGYIANVDQSETASHGILLMFSVIPGILTILTGIVLFWYNLSDDEVDKIAAELEERRGKAEA
ncbi:MFS transporter [Akkermansiaceae bacterium]|nr:MFS transporter [Akkermansiaceae bacterium]